MAPAIHNYINNRINNRTDTIDLVQEVFGQLWKSRETINNLEHLRNFLYRVAGGHIINNNRSGARERSQAPEILAVLPLEDESSGAWKIAESEMMGRLFTVVSKMNPRMRKLFFMLYMNNMSFKEIADALEVSIQHIKNEKTRIEKIIRESLEDIILNVFIILNMLK